MARKPSRWEQVEQTCVWTGDHVHRDNLADSAGSDLTCFGGGAHGGDVTADKRRDQSAANDLPPYHFYISCLHHGVGGLDGNNEAPGLDHSEGITQGYSVRK